MPVSTLFLEAESGASWVEGLYNENLSQNETKTKEDITQILVQVRNQKKKKQFYGFGF